MKRNISNMMGLDIYLDSLTDNEYDKIAPQIEANSFQKMPLLSWDIYIDHYFNTLRKGNRDQDISKVIALAEKLNWTNDVNAIFEGNPFEALVVTDISQNIIWINDGFTKMTGYNKNEVLNRTPSFLQGPKTSNKSTSRFREKLDLDQPFMEVITNYKKTNETYQCEVKIFPLFNSEKTHFIALERQVG